MAKPTCPRGHVIAEVGRHRNGRCKACNRADWKVYRAERGARTSTKDALDYLYLPVAPLRDHLRRVPLSDLERRQVDDILRERTPNITVGRADEIACRILGMNPCLVWGDDWWAA